MLDSVRTRLTLWYIGVLALVLILFSFGVYVLLGRKLYTDLDNNLETTVDGTAVSILREMREGRSATDAARSALDEHIGPRQAAAIFDANGSLIAENTALNGIHAPVSTFESVAADQIHLYTTSENKEREQRRVIVRRATAPSAKTYAIVVSQPLDEVTNGLRT